MTELLGLLISFHFLLMGLESLHLCLFFSCSLGEFLLEGNWVQRCLIRLISHHVQPSGLPVDPAVTAGWPFYLLMNFLESRQSLLNTHGCIRGSLLLKLSPLEGCQGSRLLRLDQWGPVTLRGDVAHDRDTRAATNGVGSCS